MHYMILTPVPHFRLYDKVYGNDRQPEKFNWKKMFYLNPDDIFAQVLDTFYDGKRCEFTLSAIAEKLFRRDAYLTIPSLSMRYPSVGASFKVWKLCVSSRRMPPLPCPDVPLLVLM